MDEVASTIRGYPFDFRGAQILSGMEEGAYGWVTINYVLEGLIKVSSNMPPLHVFQRQVRNITCTEDDMDSEIKPPWLLVDGSTHLRASGFVRKQARSMGLWI